VADAFAVYKGDTLLIVDWKTSKKKKTSLKSTFDAPLQVAAYAGQSIFVGCAESLENLKTLRFHFRCCERY
jgi:hypothetical protein